MRIQGCDSISTIVMEACQSMGHPARGTDIRYLLAPYTVSGIVEPYRVKHTIWKRLADSNAQTLIPFSDVTIRPHTNHLSIHHVRSGVAARNIFQHTRRQSARKIHWTPSIRLLVLIRPSCGQLNATWPPRSKVARSRTNAKGDC